MSVKVMAAAFDTILPAGEKIVLLCLGDYARDDGSRCYPSVSTLARKSSLSRRTVQRILRRLEGRGVLVPTKKTLGRSTEFFIRLDVLDTLSVRRHIGAGGCVIGDAKGRHVGAGGCVTGDAKGRHHDALTVIEPLKEPLRERVSVSRHGHSVLRNHAWNHLLDVAPAQMKREGLEDGSAREAFDEYPLSEQQGPIPAAVRNYAAHKSAEGTPGKFWRSLTSFLRMSPDCPGGHWRNWVEPRPSGSEEDARSTLLEKLKDVRHTRAPALSSQEDVLFRTHGKPWSVLAREVREGVTVI